jgi:putative tryptophan/tyrosine transport system substrate-binding protein
MMDRRRFLLTALAGALAAPRAAGAQQAAKVPRIGWLSIASRTPEASHLIEAFSLGLRELGYVEERNVAIEWRFADGKPERLPALAAELVALKVDIIVTPNPAGTQAAKEATTTVPIVMLQVADPVRSGFVASLAGPAGTSRGCPQLPARKWSANASICSGRLSPRSLEWPCSGILQIQTPQTC